MENNINTNKKMNSLNQLFFIQDLCFNMSSYLTTKEKVQLSFSNKKIFKNIDRVLRFETTNLYQIFLNNVNKIKPSNKVEENSLLEQKNRLSALKQVLITPSNRSDLSFVPIALDVIHDISTTLKINRLKLGSVDPQINGLIYELNTLSLPVTLSCHQVSVIQHPGTDQSTLRYIFDEFLTYIGLGTKQRSKQFLIKMIETTIKKKHYFIAERIINIFCRKFSQNDKIIEMFLLECIKSKATYIDPKILTKLNKSYPTQSSKIQNLSQKLIKDNM